MAHSPLGLRRARGWLPALHAVLAVLAVLVSATSCADDPAFDYVALGDSYTAAPLVPHTDLMDGCLRSDRNYPQLVADELVNADLIDVSCGGAKTADLIVGQHLDKEVRAPQFDALRKSVV